MRAEATKTVRELALQVPSAIPVFEKLGIDYCCGGGKSLSDACAAASISVDDVLHKLEESERTRSQGGERDWAQESLTGLVQHIVSTHHAYVRAQLPHLQHLLAKVGSKHGANHPELSGIQETFGDLAQELEMHMMKEEHILFPYIVEMDRVVSSGQAAPPPMFGTVQNPVRMMVLEHDNAGNALRELRQASNNYSAPADACTSYQALYRDLQAFEADLHQHIHLENNILFPRAIEMEGR